MKIQFLCCFLSKVLEYNRFWRKKVAGFRTTYTNPEDYANIFKKSINNAKLYAELSLINADVSNEK